MLIARTFLDALQDCKGSGKIYRRANIVMQDCNRHTTGLYDQPEITGCAVLVLLTDHVGNSSLTRSLDDIAASRLVPVWVARHNGEQLSGQSSPLHIRSDDWIIYFRWCCGPKPLTHIVTRCLPRLSNASWSRFVTTKIPSKFWWRRQESYSTLNKYCML
jgi:hypothetical protein